MKIYINEMTGLEWVEIEVAEGQFTAMTKETYDNQQAEQSTPIVINEAETI
jgi:hypothetical protein